MKRIDHVVLKSSPPKMHCSICLAEEKLEQPIKATKLLELSGKFLAKHEKCARGLATSDKCTCGHTSGDHRSGTGACYGCRIHHGGGIVDYDREVKREPGVSGCCSRFVRARK